MPKLTERFISEDKPNGGQKDRLVFDSEVKGLGLRATASGSKVFLCQWQDKAIPVRMLVDQLGDAVPLDAVRGRLRCSKCGLRPTSTEMTDDPSGMRDYQGLPQPRNEYGRPRPYPEGVPDSLAA